MSLTERLTADEDMQHEDRLTADDLFSSNLLTTAAPAEKIENNAVHSSCNITTPIFPAIEFVAHPVQTYYYHLYVKQIQQVLLKIGSLVMAMGQNNRFPKYI